MPYPSREIRSSISPTGTLKLFLAAEELPEPGPEEVVVRIEATPINPSDLGLLLGPADLATARAESSREEPVVTADVPGHLMGMVAGRVGKALPVGNEGAGVVVAAGTSQQARALLGKTVAVVGGGMYAQHRKLPVGMCQALPEGTPPLQAASWFVNPMTALCMVETMRMEGHTALVHTAAASNLGQMLQKLCLQEGIGLVNIVRRRTQEELLRGLGAQYVVDSSAPNFHDELVAALVATGATLAFDAIGGGTLADQILAAMEAALQKTSKAAYSLYGSSTHKQVYLYGALDRSPVVLKRSYGMAWGVGGWLLPQVLQKVGNERTQQLRARSVAGLASTFASGYTRTVTLRDALDLEHIRTYGQQATGQKYLITPNA